MQLPEQGDFEPRRPALVAGAIFILAALTLCWPMLRGDFIVFDGSDQFEAGYSFRHFAAEYFRQHHAIPQWNPYLFGGLPFVGAAHGDIFYPTAWLRWILPTDTAMNFGFAFHIVLAGIGVYALMRTLRTSWGGAVVAGLSYELTGIVISLVRPGHDGKLFVSAMAPLLLMAIVKAVRDRSWAGYAGMALTVGLALQGHPQAAMYLLIGAAVWGAFWLFGPDGPADAAGRLRTIVTASVAVVLGIGLYAVYAMPMLEYVPFSPRAEGGGSSGWQHAISFALPRSELLGLLLPQIDGGVERYFGYNPLKLHSEYLGPLVLMLAALGLGGAERRKVRIALGTLAILFLLVSLGDGTPFFRLWFEIVPMAKRLRAAGMAFFLVALPIACFAGFGAERLFRGTAKFSRAAIVGGIAASFGLLGAIGLLQNVATDIAGLSPYQGRLERAIANAATLRVDSIRLLIVSAIGLAVIWAMSKRRLVGPAAIAVLSVVVAADLFLVGKGFFLYSPPAKITYASDEIMQRLEKTPLPYRVLGPGGEQLGGLDPYPKAWLMSAGIPVLFGYHGNEMRNFDDLLGGKNLWQNQLSRNMWDLFAIRFVVIRQEQAIPGFTKILGPVNTHGGPGYLYEADSTPPYARVIAAAAKLPDAEIIANVSDNRFPIDRLVVYSDTASVSPAPFGNAIPAASTLTATVSAWEPGKMTVQINGQASEATYLVVAENWYPDWRATIDGKPATVLRGQNTLLSVVLPPGAKSVDFVFESKAYRTGKMISLASVLGVLGLFAVPWVRRRRANG